MTLGTSLGTFLICTAFNWLWQYIGLRQFEIPGFIAESTHPSLFPVEDVAPGNTNDDESGPVKGKLSWTALIPGITAPPSAFQA
jgi:hypothetical protein